MFDGEDALGQIATMSLDNQRNLKLAIERDPVFTTVAQQVAGEMNQWAHGFFGHPIVSDWKQQLDFTTKIFRARGLHLDDRHVRLTGGAGLASRFGHPPRRDLPEVCLYPVAARGADRRPTTNDRQ